MHITKRFRYAMATAAVVTSAAFAVAVAESASADSTITADPGPIALSSDLGAAKATPRARPVAAHGRAAKRPAVVGRYEVVDGDSYWAIARRQLPAGSTGNDVSTLTQALIDFNAPRLGYDVRTMLHPGDVVDIVAAPALPRAFAAAPASHLVAAGDSYWAIAESTLGPDATPDEVLAKTEELIERNSARLGYGDPAMLHPGDVIYLAAAPATPRATDENPEARRIPTSPPLSELALIATSATATAG